MVEEDETNGEWEKELEDMLGEAPEATKTEPEPKKADWSFAYRPCDVQYHSFHLFDLVYQFNFLRLYISLQYIYSKKKTHYSNFRHSNR